MKKLLTILSLVIIFTWHPSPCYANSMIVEETWDEVVAEQTPPPKETLNNINGVFSDEYGYIETYYNLPMDHIVERMRRMGFTEEDYPYYIREDGCKMLGDYIIVAADLSVVRRGSVINTSLGQGLVCDTGSVIVGNKIDIATNW